MNRLFEVGIILKAFDKATAPVRNLTEQVNRLKQTESLVRLSASTRAFSNNLGLATEEAGRLSVKLGLLGGAGGWFFKSQFIDTAAQFENFGTILETVEGDSGKAKTSLGWVSDFAAKTPYELGQVMEAFVKLKSYGLEPANGLLKTLGDTSSAMGKPLMQAVEAIADAVTGENERLKEFGIKAKVQGEKITYEYSHMGKTMTAEADKSNRQMIESTLTAIFNTKYKDSMLKQSKNWSGMMSNIFDQWTRFKIMVMQAGVFDFLKTKLQMILDNLNKLAESGKLAEIAKNASVEIIRILKDLWEITKAVTAGVRVFAGVIRFTAGLLGGYHNLIKLIVLLMSAKLIIATIKTGKSFVGMSIDVYKAVVALRNSYVIQNLLNAIEYRGGFLKALQYWLMISKYRLIETTTATKAFAIAQMTNLRTSVFAAIASLRTFAASYLTSLIPAIVSATTAVWGFTAALLANPITWIIGLVALLAGSAFLIVKYWKPISKFFTDFWNSIKSSTLEAISFILSQFNSLQKILQPITDIFEKFKLFDSKTTIENVQKTSISQNLPKIEKFNPSGITKSNASSTSITYAPNVNISGGTPQAKEEFTQMLKQHKDEVLRIIKAENQRQARLAY